MDELKPFELAKSAIKLPLDKPVPFHFVTKIVKFGAKVNLKNAQLRAKGKK